jgi:hypothetical protein
MTAGVSARLPRFQRSAFRGRCRRNLAAGLVFLALATTYGMWAGARFGRRGADAGAFDRPIVRAAGQLARAPEHLKTIRPANDRELYLAAVVSDQQDLIFGLTALVLRMIVVLTIGGLGLVLLTSGATEWEVRSEGVAH